MGNGRGSAIKTQGLAHRVRADEMEGAVLAITEGLQPVQPSVCTSCSGRFEHSGEHPCRNARRAVPEAEYGIDQRAKGLRTITSGIEAVGAIAYRILAGRRKLRAPVCAFRFDVVEERLGPAVSSGTADDLFGDVMAACERNKARQVLSIPGRVVLRMLRRYVVSNSGVWSKSHGENP
jgi:hypothetical protein